MDVFKDRRASLEKFMQEQLIGPGGCADHYGLLTPSGDDIVEVLNTTPGSIYSSAILFPLKSDKAADITLDDIAADSDDDEDIDALGRRFPDKIGISCCIKNLESLSKTKIVISGRHYIKLQDKSNLFVKIDDVYFFQKLYSLPVCQNLFSGRFIYKNGKLSLLYPFKSSDEMKNFRQALKDLNKYFCKTAAEDQNNCQDAIYTNPSFQEKNRFLSAYKERLFNKLKYFDSNKKYISQEKVKEIEQRIRNVEKYETFISYFEDLVSIFDKHAYGFWVGRKFSREIDLSTIVIDKPKLVRKLIISPEEAGTKAIFSYSVSSDVQASLSIWFQLYKAADKKIYLKVLLANDSTPVRLGMNQYYSIVSENVNQCSFFGVKLDVSNPDMLPYRNDNVQELEDNEANSLQYLYRNIKDFGIGHLCSVNWKLNGDVIHVFSDFMPSVETPDVEPEPRDKNHVFYDKEKGIYIPEKILKNNDCLQFKWLSIFSEQTDAAIVKGLIEFADAYKDWIDNLDSEQNPIGEENIRRCYDDYKRIKNNIEEFLQDPKIMHSFRLMNAAMFMQLWHSKENNQRQVRDDAESLSFEYYKTKASDLSIFNGVTAAWRPFQLAFILLNLDGIFQSKNDLGWKRRNELVDLVWFPTGGGKTESYLGLIALVILKRRLFNQDGKGNGVAAIMRYTLRLLTTQQFQRAMRMILALEQIRRWNIYSLGNEEISIGLYVGEGSLPNTYDDFKKEIDTKWSANNHGRIPLDKCPWCGDNIKICTQGKKHPAFLFACENRYCTFGKHNFYPVRFSDEHIYEKPPTLLFGTVDKFAQIAQKINPDDPKGDSRRIFGKGIGCFPPDLIIQDELHLLLGPLGSAVSLFECAIDQLCSYQDPKGFLIRPKIISSTATTRNTSLQIRALYDRAVSIFPKNGTDFDDSFFAFYKRSKDKPDSEWTYVSKRKYIGILPTGRTQMTTQMRLAAVLFVHRALYEKNNIDLFNDRNGQFIQAADYFYSVISYFNSLKEVGKTDAQFHLEFTKYTRRLFKRVLRFNDMLECFYAYAEGFSKIELTGRLSGREAVETLSKCQTVHWNPDRRLPYTTDGNTYEYPQIPADYILATNMISVGLDVSRFNLIIMNSMPRNIAEYIQASSRVAREQCGLVLSLHNPFRSRDVSHFEKFREFHEKLYYFVEPISITPFSPKAIEKYMPLYLAAIIRHTYDELAGRKCANKIRTISIDELKVKLKEYFKNRFSRTQTLADLEREILTEDQLKFICQWIDESIDQWLDQANRFGDDLVYYSARNAANEKGLFVSTDDYQEQKEKSKWVVASALRQVEPEAVLHVINK